MKVKVAAVSLALAATLLGGCAAKPAPNTQPAPQQPSTQTPAAKPEVKTTASIVDTNAAFKKAISKEGSWIAATLKDLTFTEDLVLEGEFKNKDVVARKIALYTQDADKKVTARFTLKAPKLTIKSENARIQSGTFVGDVYVEAKNFQLVDAKVEGNVYFTNTDAQSTFKKDTNSSVTGKTELKK